MLDNISSGPPPHPSVLQGDLRNLPEALTPLKELPNWVVWKWAWEVDKKTGEGRWKKPPYRPQGGYASIADPTTWGTYEEALAAFEASQGAYDGIGFNLLGTEIAAFDLDDCRNPATGDIAAEATTYIDRANSYTEISVSGTGLHVIGFGSGPYIQRKQAIGNGIVSIESYRACPRYIVVSGLPLPGSPAALKNIDAVIDAATGTTGGSHPQGPNGALGLDEWIAVNGSRHETPGDFLDIDDRRLPGICAFGNSRRTRSAAPCRRSHPVKPRAND
jgi:primase-polymerase (primpol)-like protein